VTKSSTPIAEVVEALAEHIKAEGFIRFRELDKYLEFLGINTAGDESLFGDQVNQPHVGGGVTLLSDVSNEYVQIVEALFSTKPVRLEIGDLTSFRSGEEPWYVAWTDDTDST
jgi:hypothetical protein